MVKIPFNIRIEPTLIKLIEHFAEKTKSNKTKIVETAINEFMFRNKSEIKSKELNLYLDYMNLQIARNGTKLEMRKATFLKNAIRRLKNMIKDGLQKENFNSLLFVWCQEAEANGLNKIFFLEQIEEELKKSIGSGINEL